MSAEESIIEKIEHEIADVAKKIGDFADKVAAPEEPLVILPNDEADRSNPSNKS